MIHCLLVEVENSFSLLYVGAGAIHLKDRNQATGVKLFVPGSSFHIERMIALKARPYKASDHIKLGAREALQIFDIFLHHMRSPQHLNDKKCENISNNNLWLKKSDHLVRDQYESLPSQTTWWNVGPIQLVELDLLLADAFLTDIFRPCYVCEVKNYHF